VAAIVNGAAVQAHEAKPWAGIALAALGVVFGDIGTSPLYALKEAASAAGPIQPATVLGILSLILWALVLVISVKYCTFVLKADNRGEGGIIALLALLNARRVKPGTWRAYLVVLGLVGTALLYGDGTITPAISVLSAVEGLEVYAPQLKTFVVPVTAVILILLFFIQSKGTGWIGGIFGPVILLWFAVLAVLGIGGILKNPGVFAAVNPYYAAAYVAAAGPATTLAVLASVFLAVTGGEALYADMGHFGRLPIRLAWFAVVLPGLVLNYFGQGALLLDDPDAIKNPFYQLAPGWLHYPLIVLATIATVIASQAIITGVFSLTQQAIQLGFLPRMHIVHTAHEEKGQIYVPLVNWALAAATLGAVIGFGSSAALAGAYGLAVSLDMTITTLLAAVVAVRWGWRLPTVLAVAVIFFVIDLTFFAANTTKLFEGGWFPLLVAVSVAFLMLTWRKGQKLIETARGPMRMPVAKFLEQLEADPPVRVPGTAMFLTVSTGDVPQILIHHLRHNRVLHERVFLLSVVFMDVPRVGYEERAEVIPIADGINRLILRFGFMETPDIPWAIIVGVMSGKCHADIDPGEVTYYVGRLTVIPTKRLRGMAVWREALYAFMNRNAELSATYFSIPPSQVVEIGIELEI
jgi:KUP system potassium uptake protein